jgi:hypothetical protein
MDRLPDVGEQLPDVIALARALLHQDTEGIESIYSEFGFTDAKAGGFVGELCGLFLGLADSLPDETVDGLLTGCTRRR